MCIRVQLGLLYKGILKICLIEIKICGQSCIGPSYVNEISLVWALLVYGQTGGHDKFKGTLQIFYEMLLK